MHPGIKALYTTVNALLRAEKAVVRAAVCYDRAEGRRYASDFYMRESVTAWTTPEDDALHRAQDQQREASEQADVAWAKLKGTFRRT